VKKYLFESINWHCTPYKFTYYFHCYYCPNVTTLRSGLCYCKSVCHLSVTLVTLLGGLSFRQYFVTAVYAGHPLTFVQILWRSSPETPPSGALSARGVATYSDFGPVEGYIS